MGAVDHNRDRAMLDAVGTALKPPVRPSADHVRRRLVARSISSTDVQEGVRTAPPTTRVLLPPVEDGKQARKRIIVEERGDAGEDPGRHGTVGTMRPFSSARRHECSRMPLGVKSRDDQRDDDAETSGRHEPIVESLMTQWSGFRRFKIRKTQKGQREERKERSPKITLIMPVEPLVEIADDAPCDSPDISLAERIA